MSGPIQQPLPIVQANRSAAEGGEALREPLPTRVVDAVVARLKDALPGQVHVEDYPDKPSTYDLGAREAVALVHYRGSKYRPPEGNGPVSQARALSIDVHLLTRGLGGASRAPGAAAIGSYELVEAVRLALQARTIEGCGPFYITDDGAQNERDGVWSYIVQFSAGTRAVAVLPVRRPDVGGYP